MSDIIVINKIKDINADITYINDIDLLKKITLAKEWKFCSFEESYKNCLKKLKF